MHADRSCKHSVAMLECGYGRRTCGMHTALGQRCAQPIPAVLWPHSVRAVQRCPALWQAPDGCPNPPNRLAPAGAKLSPRPPRFRQIWRNRQAQESLWETLAAAVLEGAGRSGSNHGGTGCCTTAVWLQIARQCLADQGAHASRRCACTKVLALLLAGALPSQRPARRLACQCQLGRKFTAPLPL